MGRHLGMSRVNKTYAIVNTRCQIEQLLGAIFRSAGTRFYTPLALVEAFQKMAAPFVLAASLLKLFLWIFFH